MRGSNGRGGNLRSVLRAIIKRERGEATVQDEVVVCKKGRREPCPAEPVYCFDAARDGLGTMRSKKVKEIRGVGLLNAIEIKKSAGSARIYTERLKELGILAKDTHGKTIRFAPPLVITEKEVDWMIEVIKKVLE